MTLYDIKYLLKKMKLFLSEQSNLFMTNTCKRRVNVPPSEPDYIIRPYVLLCLNVFRQHQNYVKHS